MAARMTSVDAWGGSWGTNWAASWTYSTDQPAATVAQPGAGRGRRRRFDYPNMVDDGWLMLRPRPQASEPEPTERYWKAPANHHADLAERLLALRLGLPLPTPPAEEPDEDDAEQRRALFRQLQPPPSQPSMDDAQMALRRDLFRQLQLT
jgi:hypothetical protein